MANDRNYEEQYIFELLQDYFPDDKDKLRKVYSAAVKTGMFYVESCIDAIVDAVGYELAPKVLYEMATKGKLFFAEEYLNVPEAIESLRKHLGPEETAKALIQRPEYLYLFKDETYADSPDQKFEREKEIQKIIKMYK